jgi:hypothetical protein
MGRAIPPNIAPILRWVFDGLAGFQMSEGANILIGAMDSQSTLAGGGSCGVASTNYHECRAGLGIPQWLANQSSQFRDNFLQDLLLYHLIACNKNTVSASSIKHKHFFLNDE